MISRKSWGVEAGQHLSIKGDGLIINQPTYTVKSYSLRPLKFIRAGSSVNAPFSGRIMRKSRSSTVRTVFILIRSAVATTALAAKPGSKSRTFREPAQREHRFFIEVDRCS